MTMKYTHDFKAEIKLIEKGEILLAKNQLERTVKDLTEEIERLSIVNNQLVQDLSSRSFFNKYYEVLEELNQLKREQDDLIDLKFNWQNNVNTLISLTNSPLVTSTGLAFPEDLSKDIFYWILFSELKNKNIWIKILDKNKLVIVFRKFLQFWV